MKDNPISSVADVYRTATINPLVNSGIQGAASFGLGMLAWDRLVETARSLLRRPVLALTDMTPREYEREVDDIKDDNKMRWIIPGFLGTGIAGASMLASHRANEAHGGLLNWNAEPRKADVGWRGYAMPGEPRISKKACLQKFADSMFEYGGYVPQLDFSKIIDAPTTKQQLFTNDPWIQNDPYTKNMGIAILSDAQNRTGASNVPLGSVFDSAVDKFKSKFSFSGVASIGAQTMFANAASTLFVKALDAMTDLDKEDQQKLIELGTWAGAAKAILD